MMVMKILMVVMVTAERKYHETGALAVGDDAVGDDGDGNEDIDDCDGDCTKEIS